MPLPSIKLNDQKLRGITDLPCHFQSFQKGHFTLWVFTGVQVLFSISVGCILKYNKFLLYVVNCINSAFHFASSAFSSLFCYFSAAFTLLFRYFSTAGFMLNDFIGCIVDLGYAEFLFVMAKSNLGQKEHLYSNL